MKAVIVGNHAVSWGAQLARVEVVSAYPITPQTQIVEELAEMCTDGRLAARFVKVESEHSALACLVGASAVGVRTFTATSAQGLALMHEVLHYAVGARLPIVMADVNRAMAPGWSIWTDQNDSLAQRDTGWMQMYAESNQEVVDTIVQAFKVAEDHGVLLPAMIVLDAFVLSHTSEPVDLPDQAAVDEFLPKRVPKYKLDVDDPHAFNALVAPDHYMEHRRDIEDAMQRAAKLWEDVDAEWGRRFGRRYGPAVEAVRCDGAEIVLVTSGAITSTARVVVDELRAEGRSVGLLKMRMFRPFPRERVRAILRRKKKAVILDRNFSHGAGGIWAQEIRNALYDLPERDRPQVHGFVLGLGGRDVTPAVVRDVFDRARGARRPVDPAPWIGLREY